MQVLPYIIVGLGVTTATMQVKAGREAAKGYAAQATQARLQAKQEALRYREQGVKVLDNILKTQAAVVARAGAGGLDPFSGSAAGLQQYALAKGATELFTIQDNQVITLRSGELEAQQLMIRGKSAQRQGLISGFSTLLTAASGAQQTGGGVL